MITGPLPKLTREFVSANQVITAAGTLSLAHGLGVAPKVVALELVCLVANLNYAVADVVPVSSNATLANSGVAVIPDAANVVLRFGSAAGTFTLLNKTTGASAAITNASWALRVRAWA